MIFCSHSDFERGCRYRINNLIGESISLRKQLKDGASGSALYRITSIKLKNNHSNIIDLNTRCDFEKFKKGFLLRINQNQELYYIAMAYDSIDSIELIKGEEEIVPLGLMSLLLNAGVHIRYARYFKYYRSEYSIKPMKLVVRSGTDKIELVSNGFNYYSQKHYFSSIKRKSHIR